MTSIKEQIDQDPFGKDIMENMFRDQKGEKPTLEAKGAPYWFVAEWREGRTPDQSRLAAVPGPDSRPIIWEEKETAKREFASRYGNAPYLLMQANEGRKHCFVEQVGSRMARPATMVHVPAIVEMTLNEIRTHTDGERKHTQGEWPKLSSISKAKKGKKDKQNVWFIKGERQGTVCYWKRSADGNATQDYLDNRKKWWGCSEDEIKIITEESAIYWRDVQENANVIVKDTDEGQIYLADGQPVFWHANENLATVRLNQLVEQTKKYGKYRAGAESFQEEMKMRKEALIEYITNTGGLYEEFWPQIFEQLHNLEIKGAAKQLSKILETLVKRGVSGYIKEFGDEAKELFGSGVITDREMKTFVSELGDIYRQKYKEMSREQKDYQYAKNDNGIEEMDSSVPVEQRISALADAWYDGMRGNATAEAKFAFKEKEASILRNLRDKHDSKREFVKAAQTAIGKSKKLDEQLDRGCLLDVAEAMNVNENNLHNIGEDEFREMAENAAIKAKLVTIYRNCYRQSGLQEARRNIAFDSGQRQYTFTIQKEDRIHLIDEAEKALKTINGIALERTEADDAVTFTIIIGEAKETQPDNKALLKKVVRLLNHKPRYTSDDADSYDVAAEIDKCLKDGKKDSPALWRKIQKLLNAAPRFSDGENDSYKVASEVDKLLAKNESINGEKVTKTMNESVADLAQRKALKDIVRAAITSVGVCPVSKKELEESNAVVIDIPKRGQTVVHAEVWEKGKGRLMAEHPNAIVHDGRLLREGQEFDPFTSKNPKKKFDPFVAGYITAALFTLGEDEAKELGVKTSEVTIDHLAPEAIKDLTKVAKDFWEKYQDTIEEADLDPERAGQLLYYAHSGAGVTWLDDDDNEALRKLDKAKEAQYYASPYGLYVGDDGKLYRENVMTKGQDENAANDFASLLDSAGLTARQEINEARSIIESLIAEGHTHCAVTNKELTPENTVVVTIPGKARFLMDATAFDKKKDKLKENVQVIDGRLAFNEEFKSHTAKDEDEADANYEKWENLYKPQKNHLNNNAAYNGWLYETYGDELKFVQETSKKDPDRVWTLIEGDEGMYISSGYHHVNRIGYFITKNKCQEKDGCDWQIEVYDESDEDDEDLDESVVSAGISGSSELGKQLHQWHADQNDPIYKVGSMFIADKVASMKLCKSAVKALKAINDPEAKKLGDRLHKLCGGNDVTEEGLAKLAHAIAETTAAFNRYQELDSMLENLGARVLRTAKQMGGGVRTYGLTIRETNGRILSEQSQDTGNINFTFVPFDEATHTNTTNEFHKISEAANKAMEDYDTKFQRAEKLVESLGIEPGKHDTPIGVIEISPEGKMRLTHVKSETFEIDEDNPVRSWMVAKPFREYATMMTKVVNQQFVEASAKAAEVVKKAGGRLDFGGFALTNENDGVSLYGNGKGVIPFLENIVNGTIAVEDPIKDWATNLLLKRTFKTMAENLGDIEDRSRSIVLDHLPENAVAAISFDGRDAGTLVKRGERSVFVDSSSTDRVFGSQPMTEADSNIILAWSRLHDINEPDSLEEQSVYNEQLAFYNEQATKVGEAQKLLCFYNDANELIQVFEDAKEGIVGSQVGPATHKISNKAMEVVKIEAPKEESGNKAFSEHEEVPVDMSAARLTLELRNLIRDMNSGIIEKAGAAAVNVGGIADATIKAWTEKLGGTYQESDDTSLFEGATSITDTITRSWVLLDQAKKNIELNDESFDSDYGRKLAKMVDEAIAATASTIESFYAPAPRDEKDSLSEQLVIETAADIQSLFGSPKDLVESTSVLDPSSLKRQAIQTYKSLDQVEPKLGPKSQMPIESKKMVLNSAHGIVSMANALLRALGKKDTEAKLAHSRMEKDPLFQNWKSAIDKRKDPKSPAVVASEEVKALRDGLSAASSQMSRVSGDGVEEMRKAIASARKIVNKIGAEVSIKNLGNPNDNETQLEAKDPPKPKVELNTLVDEEQATVVEYMALQRKIKALKSDIENLETSQEPSKQKVVEILEKIQADLMDADGVIISLRKQPGKILYNKIIDQLLKRVNEATKKIINALMESTRGDESKYPVMTEPKTKSEALTEGILARIMDLGKKAIDALVKKLKSNHEELTDAVYLLKTAVKNARMGIVSEVASRKPEEDNSGKSDLSPDSGLANKDGKRTIGASREKPGNTKPKTSSIMETKGKSLLGALSAVVNSTEFNLDDVVKDTEAIARAREMAAGGSYPLDEIAMVLKAILEDIKLRSMVVKNAREALEDYESSLREDWPSDGSTGKPDLKPAPVGDHKNKRIDRPEDDASYDRKLKPKQSLNEDPCYSGELRTKPDKGLANQSGNDPNTDSPYEPEGSVKRDEKRPEV